MDIIISFIICFILLAISAFKEIFVAYALGTGLLIFMYLAYRRGFSIKQVIVMTYKGGKKSLIVLQIFILIGAITSIWMASGTVPAIVYYGLKFLNPKIFVLSAFLICSLISFLMGTSFGTVGTVGIALMVMARGGGVNTAVAAGAILSGAYFGDRCSPMSSSANLVALLTETDIYRNIKNMLKTSIIPFLGALICYLVLSYEYPIKESSTFISTEILKSFNVSYFVMLPAVIILILSFFKVNVKISILISIITAFIISIMLQGNSILHSLKFLIFGYAMEGGPLKDIIKGGGLLSMLKVALVVFISSAFTGVFEETKMLNGVEKILRRSKGREGGFLTTILVSIVTAAFGCSQALAVILTEMLVKGVYRENKLSKEDLAVDLENSAIVIAPLIPWNIAVLVPLTTLSVGSSAILFACYLYLLPLINLIYLKIWKAKTATKS